MAMPAETRRRSRPVQPKMLRSPADRPLSGHLFPTPRSPISAAPAPVAAAAGGRYGRKKPASRLRPFRDFYAEWVSGLRSTLLPLLRRSMSAASAALLDPSVAASAALLGPRGGPMVSSSDLLSVHVHALHAHLQAYFQALDLAARRDPTQLLLPEWRNPLEAPFLWLGDFHPEIFTNLLRAFLQDRSSRGPVGRRGLPFAGAWDSPSRDLVARVEQIERGLRLMVPALARRLSDAQAAIVEVTAAEWATARGKAKNSSSSAPIERFDEATGAQIEELASVVLDANRLRRSILAEIVGATDLYQAALYLEALAQFVVGFRDSDLVRSFEQSRIPVSPPSLD